MEKVFKVYKFSEFSGRVHKHVLRVELNIGKQRAKPVHVKIGWFSTDKYGNVDAEKVTYSCPKCNQGAFELSRFAYCPYCGQRHDWSGVIRAIMDACEQEKERRAVIK